MDENTQIKLNTDYAISKLKDKGYLFLIISSIPFVTVFLLPPLAVLAILILANFQETTQIIISLLISALELFFIIKTMLIGKKLFHLKNKVHGLILMLVPIIFIVISGIFIYNLFIKN